MEIIVAKRAGFCFGVKRAIDITFALAKEKQEGLCTFGPLIHNPQVVEKLKQEGVKPIDDIHSPDIKTLIIRTHGVSPEVYAETEKMGYKVVDATCPFVKKAQRYVKKLNEEGYQVLIIGNREHPEVKGLVGFAGNNVFVADTVESLPSLKARVGIIVQTTQRLETLENIALQVLRSAREVKIYNTICDYTILRVKETRDLARSVDVVIVVGGKNSANTTQLVNLSKQLCKKVYHIETGNEIQKEWFNRAHKVGITGGASTPQWIIEEVADRIREISHRR